jgi:hypothetical protein
VRALNGLTDLIHSRFVQRDTVHTFQDLSHLA